MRCRYCQGVMYGFEASADAHAICAATMEASTWGERVAAFKAKSHG